MPRPDTPAPTQTARLQQSAGGLFSFFAAAVVYFFSRGRIGRPATGEPMITDVCGLP